MRSEWGLAIGTLYNVALSAFWRRCDLASVHGEQRGGVAWIRLDDGKVNVLTPEVLEGIGKRLQQAESEAVAVVLTGREGRFSAGLDLLTMAVGAEEGRALVTHAAELLLQIYEHPRPVVVACSGHAVAMGALLLLAADYRVGVPGDFKIGLNETAIGMTLPVFAIELARDRLSKRHFDRATVQAELYAPQDAVDAGYLDALAPPETLEERAQACALRLGQLRRGAFAATKRRAHAVTLERCRATLEGDLAGLIRR